MSLYKFSAAPISLTSWWACSKKTDTARPDGYWVISQGPHAGTQHVSFDIDLPDGAVVARAWIAAKTPETPLGGIQHFRMNGTAVPPKREIEIEIDPGITSFDVEFSYLSHGVIFNDEKRHYGVLGVQATLYVDYVSSSGGSAGETKPGAGSSAKEMRLPRYLGEDMKEKTRLHCSSLSIELNLDPLSTAEMSLPAGSPIVMVDDFVELYTPYGSAGIFRIAQTEEIVGAEQKCSLRHGIITLADDIVPAGNAISAPVAQVFSSLFAMQTVPIWALGECQMDADVEMVLERNFQTLLAAFSDLTAHLPDGYAWQFDQTTTPWLANLVKLPDDDSCEFRLTRNVRSLAISTNRDSQCTRLYAFGAGEGEERIGLTNLIGTPYIDALNAPSGKVIAKSITRDDIFDALTLKNVAERYLERHKDPEISVRVDGIDLHKMTGLSFDKFHLGKICRVPMPVYGKSVREKVISISWHDVVSAPLEVTATLANRLRDASDELAEIMREATNGKLLGGTVESTTSEARYDGITQSKSLVHYFDITGYGNTLSVRAEYSPAGKCLLRLDSDKEVPASEAENGTVDVLRYLKSDDNGVPLVGRHYISYFALGTEELSVSSKITIKTVGKGGSSVVPPADSTIGQAVYTSDGMLFVTSDGATLFAKGG